VSSSPVIELIKEKLDIAEIVQEYLPDLKKAGRNYKACCPFHKEKTPSFTVSPEKGIFYCFGCGESGDIFTFVQKMEGLTFHEAAKKLALKAGVDYGDDKFYSLTQEDRERIALRKVLSRTAEFYRKTLFSAAGEKARLYLGERRVSKASVDKFGIGFSPSSGNALTRELSEAGVSPEIAVKAGVLAAKDGRYYDYFRGRIMFPIKNQSGDVIAFGGRVLDPEMQPKYLNSPETPLFSKRRTLYGLHEAMPEIRTSSSALIVEGYMDVIGAHQHGVGITVAPLGTSLTEEHARILGRKAEDIILMFDADAAGVQASVRASEVFMNENMYVKIASLDGNLDPDEYLNERGEEAFYDRLKKAADPLEYRINLFYTENPTPTAQDKAKEIKRLLAETISRQQDDILKSEWIKRLSYRFNVDYASVVNQADKIYPRNEKTVEPPEEKINMIPPLEYGIIQILVKNPGLVGQAQTLLETDFSSPLAGELFSAVRNTPPEEQAGILQSLREKFPLASAELIKMSLSETVAEDTDEASDFSGAVKTLKRFAIKRKLRQLKAAPLTPEKMMEYQHLTEELKASDK